MNDFLQRKSVQRFVWWMIEVVVIAGGGWTVTSILIGYTYRADGYKYLNQALEILGDQNPEPDFCVEEIGDPQALGLVRQAIGALEKARKVMPADSQVLPLLGRGFCLSGRIEEAVEMYEAYTALRPKNPLGHLELGFTYEEAGWDDMGIAKWKQGGVREEVFLEKGLDLENKGTLDQALMWYEKSVFMFPQMAEGSLKVGLILEKQGDHPQALPSIQKAWALNPEIGTSTCATLLENTNQINEAEVVLRVLREALDKYRVSNERYQWWGLLGKNLNAQEKWDKTVIIYLQAVEEFPNDIDFHIELGWSYYRRDTENGFVLSKLSFEQAIALNPQLGQLYRQDHRFVEADFWFRQALSRNPEAKWWYMARGNIARSANNYHLALEVYNETIQRFPDFPQAYYEIAWVYYLKEEPQNALLAIQQALSLMSPSSVSFYVRAGQIYESNRVHEKATEVYQQALLLDPSNINAQNGY